MAAAIKVRKHRAPKGALRRIHLHFRWFRSCSVRKHRAPNGALRHGRLSVVLDTVFLVRKHRAPNGALRPAAAIAPTKALPFCQKAPSAKRCIKTGPFSRLDIFPGCASESSDHTNISHVIPYRIIASRGQKPRNINDLLSNIERLDRELRATFTSNHPEHTPRAI